MFNGLNNNTLYHSSSVPLDIALQPMPRDKLDEKYGIKRIDLRHRLPFVDSRSEKIRIIQDEIDLLPAADRIFFLNVSSFCSTGMKTWMISDPFVKDSFLKIINYLEGAINLDEVGINRENGARFLRFVKLFDLAYILHTRLTRKPLVLQNSTYELRVRILDVLSPDLETLEAFTYAILPKAKEYYQDVKNWQPERIRFIANLVVLPEFIRMRVSSQKLQCDPPEIIATRGNTASRKTSEIKQRYGENIWTDNPDNRKFILKIKTCRERWLTNAQVHKEVTRGPLSMFKEGLLKLTKYSFILDSRLSLNEEFQELVVAAKKRGSYLSLIDIETPLFISLESVLYSRHPFGEAPCAPSSAIRDGFIEIRRCRSGIIDRAIDESVVHRYELLFAHGQERAVKVAEKDGPSLRIYSPDLFNTCVANPTLDELAVDLNQPALRDPWKGIPMRIALDCHAAGLTNKEAALRFERERQFGVGQTMPFNGSWLIDYPQVKEHLCTEHLLHVRGLDEKGVGIHWDTSQIGWRLNPQYNPEAGGGFQMKLGYFIIPGNFTVGYIASVSKEVHDNLKVFSPDGTFIGYRFFVHPEALSHFHALFEAGIPFVSSKNSEFMGTPTSSYRSWAVRQVDEGEGDYLPKEGTVPFIVKLGVSGAVDRNRLLPSWEVEKSVKAQLYFDLMQPYPDLLIFRETLGLSLKDIPNYPPKPIYDTDPIDSGMIIREFPREFLDGKCKILSFSAVMSVERMKYPHSFSINSDLDGRLPLIYALMNHAIEKGVVRTPIEYIQRFFIDSVCNALEKPVFKEALSLALHAQNLCLVLDLENIPIGVAIRDHGDMHRIERFLETYFHFYRDSVFKPLLNVIARSQTYELPRHLIDVTPMQERSVFYYLATHEKGLDDIAKEALNKLSIVFEEYQMLVSCLDSSFYSLLRKYFDVDKIPELQRGGTVPFAEIGSYSPEKMMNINFQLYLQQFGRVPGQDNELNSSLNQRGLPTRALPPAHK